MKSTKQKRNEAIARLEKRPGARGKKEIARRPLELTDQTAARRQAEAKRLREAFPR